MEGVLIRPCQPPMERKPRIKKAQLLSDVRKLSHNRMHEPLQLKAKALAKAAAQK
jgi:hypothetical protein